MNKRKLFRTIESICPSSLAEEWDNCGVQVDTQFNEVHRILVALEITDQVIQEAVDRDVDLIVTHHPLIFGALHKVDCHDVTGNYIHQLIRNGISVYSCHTSFDTMVGGNNDYLGYLLGIKEMEPFEEGDAMCRKGVTPFEITLQELVKGIATRMDIEERKISVVGNPNQSICTIGWCTGAGGEFIPQAVKEGLDVYLTGDLKYHDAQLAKALGLAVIDLGHYGSEKIFVENMAELLSRKTNCEVMKTRIDIDPFL